MPLIDPRHEVPPHGEAVWPYIPNPAKREPMKSWARAVLAGFAVALVVIVALLFGAVFGWVRASEMPRGPFLGGAPRVDPYGHPSHAPQLASAKKKISPAMRVFLNDQSREVAKENRMATKQDNQERQRAKRLRRRGRE